MSIELDITPEMQARIAAIARRSGLSASEIITDALENGHSLEWQERFLDKVAAGLEAAGRGEFATVVDMQRVRNKYRASS